ncbi:MAG: class I SAM-dependent methyltransferase [Acidobacteriota bacterium]|nr:class I SAM-dependent methyltransferase [Blastocatellia bacterium]MDW8411735.1 class I SAM-dependent methyltransferase [Acidobacteriota bacterium]
MGQEIEQKEALFHDEWAAQTDISQVDIYAAFEAITSPENRFILKQIGSLQGKRILDVGSGLGESSVYFALKGADVTMVDISPGMIELALKLGKAYGVELKGIVANAETLNVPDESFDVIYVANLIHHIQDRERFLLQAYRALVPGGLFISWDPIAYNPVINVYRRIANKVRTEDERPLTIADLQLVQRIFGKAEHKEFWLLTLVLFLKYYLIDRVHPNADRYWKRILRETPETLPWFLPLQELDEIILRLPLLRWLAWNIVIWARK